MFDLLQTLFAFILTLGVLITAHEWGHYWVAKKSGIKILRFSVGFGKALWTRRSGPDQTEFVVAALPLGGYVKMLDEMEGDVAEAEAHRAFNRQSLPIRAAVVAAGPIFNFLLAILLYALMFMWGVEGVRPLVGKVTPDSAAASAGLRTGQEIISLNGEPTPHWETVMQGALNAAIDHEALTFQVRDERNQERIIVLNTDDLSLDDFTKHRLFKKLGLEPYRPPVPALIAEIVPGSAAERDGLLAGDRVLRVNGKPVADWHAWADYISAHPQQTMQVEVQRNDATMTIDLTPGLRENTDQGFAGVGPPRELTWPAEYLHTERYDAWDALLKGMDKTWEITLLTLRLLGKMLTLEISADNISGPVSIAQYAGYSLDAGTTTFLAFLALVSISLGVLNLMPIPLLDGGHLLLYLIEWIKGGPVSEQSLWVFQRIGLTFLILLMGLAFFNDFNRLWG